MNILASVFSGHVDFKTLFYIVCEKQYANRIMFKCRVFIKQYELIQKCSFGQ